MGRKLSITLAISVVLMIGAAVAAYAYDASRSEQIAEGVTIGAIDVGGMEADAARSLIKQDLIQPLAKPVTVTHDGVRYQLGPEQLKLRADIDGMIEEAVELSREGGLPTRLIRYASGGEVEEAIDPEVSYDEGALDEFVAKVAGGVNRAPVDATVEPSPSSLDPVAARAGVAVAEADLRRQVEAAVQSPVGRRVEAEVKRVPPEVTTEELAAQYPVYLTVDRGDFELKVWQDLKLSKTYTVAIGAAGYETPAGLYSIQNKAVDPAWSVPERDWAGKLAGTTVPGGVPENPLKERWLGIYDGAGIHGTDEVGTLGSAVSRGCVRMAVDDVIEVYDQVPIGTPIYIG